MRRVFTLVAIFSGALVLGAISTPPDPFTIFLAAGVLALFGIACYVIGLCEGRAAPPR